ncbi:hypothetical protein HPB47_006311 [Ixodes persulcatus]|uniref:Uncharacterized protein n=1 Tax=Ixodes persulcatus TaxID=34615 RepID=A0AC60PAR7_IXOPE|nr:hypothetical protein HPB47_006311 [Ixodes persulcatus]
MSALVVDARVTRRRRATPFSMTPSRAAGRLSGPCSRIVAEQAADAERARAAGRRPGAPRHSSRDGLFREGCPSAARSRVWRSRLIGTLGVFPRQCMLDSGAERQGTARPPLQRRRLRTAGGSSHYHLQETIRPTDDVIVGGFPTRPKQQSRRNSTRDVVKGTRVSWDEALVGRAAVFTLPRKGAELTEDEDRELSGSEPIERHLALLVRNARPADTTQETRCLEAESAAAGDPYMRTRQRMENQLAWQAARARPGVVTITAWCTSKARTECASAEKRLISPASRAVSVRRNIAEPRLNAQRSAVHRAVKKKRELQSCAGSASQIEKSVLPAPPAPNRRGGYEAIEANPMQCECHVTSGRSAATRDESGPVTALQRWIGCGVALSVCRGSS